MEYVVAETEGGSWLKQPFLGISVINLTQMLGIYAKYIYCWNCEGVAWNEKGDHMQVEK